MIDHKAYEARLLAVELPAAEDQKTYGPRVRRRKQGRATAADTLATAARLRAAERPTLEGIVAEAEKELGKRLPKGYRRPAIDNRDDALYALRLACHVAGCTYFNDAHPWNRPDVIDAIRAAETRKLRPFIRRIARLAFGPTMRGLYMPPGTFRLETKLLDEDTDTVPKSWLAAVPRDAASPADDDAHPLGRLDSLRRLFDAQTPVLQADVIDFVRLAYGSTPTWMTIRPAKPRGGKRVGAGRPAGAKQRPKLTEAEQELAERETVERTAEQKRRRQVAYYNRWKLDGVLKHGGVLERDEPDSAPTEREPEDPIDLLTEVAPRAGTDGELPF